MQYSTIISLLKVLTTYHSKIVQVKDGPNTKKTMSEGQTGS